MAYLTVPLFLAVVSPICSRQLFGVATFCAVLASAGRITQAAPVVFAFEATISEVNGDATVLDLPFTLTVGQEIEGRYTFQSNEDMLDVFLNRERGTQGELFLTIDGIEIQAPTNFGSLNSLGVLDPPIVGPTSSILLDYISPTDVFPGWPGSVHGHLWSQRLLLVGTDGTITSPEHLLDVEAWNQLTTLRRLDLQFGFPDTVSVQAAVGDFFAVPEPSSAWIVWALVTCALAFFLFRKLLIRIQTAP
jgi:hypothetical protein